MAVAEENIWRVEDYFTNNVKTSIRTAADDLNLTFSTIWVIMRKQLKWRAYRPIKVKRLTNQNKLDRLAFAQWLLSQPEEFEQKVCFSDEMWFMVHPMPNS